MNEGHKVIAMGQAASVHAELAEVRWKSMQQQKAFRRERWIHIGVNLILSLWLLWIYCA